MAAFKRSADGETLTKRQRMQNDIEAYTEMQVKPKIAVRMNPDFPITRKTPQKSKKGGRKSVGKMVISELGKRVKKYDLINNLALAQAGMPFGCIARGDIYFAKNELQRIVPGKVGWANENFAGKDEVLGVSTSRHLLVRVEVYSESSIALFDSGAIPNVIFHKMMKKLHLRMQPKNRSIKVANCASEKCVGTLNEVPISLGELVVPMDFLVLEETPYDILIGLPTMIQLRAHLDYYRMVLKIHYGGDYEILDYEYERETGNSSKDGFTSDSAYEDELEVEDSTEKLVLMLNELEKKTESSDEDQLVDEKLSQLNSKDAEAAKKLIRDHPEVIAKSFEDVRPSIVSVTHHFELTSENPIYQKKRRMSPSHYEIVRKEIDRMLLAGIIAPIESPWTSPLVIATKKDRSARFCVDYRNLNSVMHANRWPLPRLDKILNEKRGSSVFKTIDLFEGY